MEIKTIKKSQKEITLEIENLGKRAVFTNENNTNRMQEIEERISDIEDTIEDTDKIFKGNAESKKFLTQSLQEIQDSMKRPNLRITGIYKSEDSQLEGPANIFIKIIEEKFPNLK